MSYRWLVVLLMLLPCIAQAHRFAPSLLELEEQGDGVVTVRWKTPVQQASRTRLSPHWPDHCTARQIDSPVIEGTGQVVTLRLHCEGSLQQQTLGVDGLAENRAAALVSVRLLDGRYFQQILNENRPLFTVPEKPRSLALLGDYMVLGATHIWGGPDHLLFVLGLVLLVKRGRALVWTVTAFTAGHSVTLSLVTLGFFSYPVALVEAAIALSIFAVAVALTQDTGAFWHLLRQHPWWLAAGFGLLHGMGFAGALAEVGLPQGEVPLALLSFNVGIELGQLAFIAAIFLCWWLAKPVLGERNLRRLWPVPVYVLGTLSVFWCIERLLAVATV